MKNKALSYSTHNSTKYYGRGLRPSFLARQFGSYNLGELTIVLGIGSAAALVITLLLSVALSMILDSLLTLPNALHVTLISTAFLVWLTAVILFWNSLVRLVRIQRATRVTNKDLLWMQILFFMEFTGISIFDSRSLNIDWQSLHRVSLLFEWIVIGFHIVYLLLAFSVGVRVPRRQKIAFALILAFTVFHQKIFN
jgi:hypothetical protein